MSIETEKKYEVIREENLIHINNFKTELFSQYIYTKKNL